MKFEYITVMAIQNFVQKFIVQYYLKFIYKYLKKKNDHNLLMCLINHNLKH
jgi:hypothetical protein